MRDDDAMYNIVVRPARRADLVAVAELRWRMRQASEATDGSPDRFVRRFVAWVSEHESSHRCVVAVHNGMVIGVAWLAITPRVPHPGALRRASGDLQSVFVLPEHRNCGVGSRLVEAVLALARDAGLERVTVHSSDRAVPVYERSGFASSPVLLQATVATVS